MNDEMKRVYTGILEHELIPAYGCTEPVAIALAAAKAREVLGRMPERIRADCCKNVIKNAWSVRIPGMDARVRGIPCAAAAGALAGDASLGMEVLINLNGACADEILEMTEAGFCTVHMLDTDEALEIRLTACAGGDEAVVEIKYTHSHFSRIEKNGKILLLDKEFVRGRMEESERGQLNLRDILDYAGQAGITDPAVKLVEYQAEMNLAIAKEGLAGRYGANVGQTLLASNGPDAENRARALAAAGSDARMGGCAKPAVVNSGSGNQGITVSVPVAVFAESMGADRMRRARALIISNLVALRQKAVIGRLSAYCGAISAACGAGAGIAYLSGADERQIERTIVNALANVSGIICDGANSSCAAKIASALDGAFLGCKLAMSGNGFLPGEGIVKPSAEQTILGVGRIAKEGMAGTDDLILDVIMS